MTRHYIRLYYDWISLQPDLALTVYQFNWISSALCDTHGWYDMQYLMTTPDTSYNPLDPEHDSDRILTAWDLMPVFAASNEEKIIPDGLFLMGQV